MIKAIIFDVDGTLVDSVDLHTLAWRDAFRDFGHDYDLKALRDQIGKGGDQLMPVFMSEYDAEAATKAGIRMVGLLCGGWSEEDLMKAGCIAVYRDPSDLLARYEMSPLAKA